MRLRRRTDDRHALGVLSPWLTHLLLIVILTIALAATALAAVWHSNWSELLRRVAVLQLRNSLQREVSLQHLSIDLQGRAVLTNLVVRNTPVSRRPLFSVKRLEIHFDPARLLASPGLPASSFRQVIAESPFVQLTRNTTGTWNIDDLLIQKEPSKDKFCGEVVVQHGEVIYQDACGWTAKRTPLNEHLVNLSAHLTQAGDYMPFQASATITTGDVRNFAITGGIRRAKNDLQCDIRYGDINLPFAQRLIAKKLPVTFQAGHADGHWQLALTHAPKTGKLEWKMTLLADLHDVQGTIKIVREMPYTIAHGQVRLADDALQFVDTRGTVGGLPVEINGDITNFADPVFSLQLKTTSADTPTLIHLVPGVGNLPYRWGGRTDGWAQITGPLGALSVVGHVHGPSVAAKFGSYTDLDGDLAYTDSALTLSNLTGRGFGGTLAGNVWVSLAKGKLPAVLAQAQVADVDVHRVMAQFIPITATAAASAPPVSLHDLRGILSGPVTVKVATDGQITVITQARGAVSVKNITHADVDAGLQLNITDQGVRTRIQNLDALVPEVHVQAQGEVYSTGSVHLSVRGSMVDINALGARFQRNDLGGTGFFSGDITGTLAQPHFAGTIHAKNGVVAGHKFNDFSSEVHASLTPALQVSLQKIYLLAGGNQMQLSELAIPDFTKMDWAANGTLLLHPTTFGALKSVTGVDIPLNGVVQAEMHFTDDDDPAGTLELYHPWLTIGKQPLEFDRATVHFTLRPEEVEVTDARLVYHGAALSVSGTVPFDQRTLAPQACYLRMQANALNLDDFTTLVACDSPQAGRVTTDGRLALPLDVAGQLNLDATLTAQLTPGKNETPAETLARTLVLKTTVENNQDIVVAGIPYQQLHAALEYRGESHTLALTQFAFARNDAGGGYAITLTEPGNLNLANHEVDLHAALQGARLVKETPCDLERFRTDLLAIAANTIGDSSALKQVAAGNPPADAVMEHHHFPAYIAQVVQALQQIPMPFAGKGAFKIDLEGALQQPVITTDLACTEMVIGGNAAPNLEGSVIYDTAPRMITIKRLLASGGPDPNASITLGGAITLPLMDGHGYEKGSDPVNLKLEAQNINPSLLGDWLHNSWLQELKGEVMVVATIDSTVTDPHLVASIDVIKPSFRQLQFDSLTPLIITLDSEGLWIGDWMKANDARLAADADHDGARPVVIGDRMIYPDAGAPLQFIGADAAPIEPLEIIGHLPFHWKGLLQPSVPVDEPVYFSFHLPRQGLDVVKSYLPQPPPKALQANDDKLLCAFPQGDDWSKAFRVYLTQPPQQAGTVEGDLEVKGTLAEPQVANGIFRMRAPEMRFSVDDKDLPDRMRDTVVDLGFSSTGTKDHRVNLVKVNDLSTIFDRSGDNKQKTSNRFRWFEKLFGISTPSTTPLQGSLVAQGTIQIDPRRLFNQGKLLPADKLLDQLDYDLYAKSVRTPMNWRDLFNGVVSGYVRLGNDPDAPHLPQLTGVLYVENAQLKYGEMAGAPGKFVIPFNPELSLALQVGPDDMFKLADGNLTEFYFTPTDLYPPFSQADKAFSKPGMTGKPAVERDHPAYRYTENTLLAYGGSHGRITGTLLNPTIQADFIVVPDASQIQFPGGVLTVDEGIGDLRFTPNEPLRLYVKRGSASGMLGEYKVSAQIDGANVFQSSGQLPIHFTTVSTPPGVPPLEDKEIASRLVGVNSLTDVLQGKQQAWAPIYTIGEDYLFHGWLAKAVRKVGLDTFNVKMHPGQFPEMTLTTHEFAKSKWTAFRLGTSRVLSTPPTWKLWLDYRLPDSRLLRNLSVTAQTNELHEMDYNLRYQWEF